MAFLKKVFVFSLLFSLLDCTCSSYDEFDYSSNELIYIDDSSSAESCRKRQFNENEKKMGAYKCCYQTADCYINNDGERVKVNYKACVIATQAQYERLEELIKEERTKCSDFDADCSATALSYLFIIFILLFLL